MDTTTTTPLLKTPFHGFHVERGAKLVDFAGWEMPLHYGSIIEEHKQVRRSGGLFDVSHMGRLRFTGKDAARFLDRLCTRQVATMTEGQVRYSLVCNESGGCRDDVLVYCLAGHEFLMVCNASNRLKLLAHVKAVRGDMKFSLADETESTAMVAIQGPQVMEILGGFSREVRDLKRYRFTVKNLIVAKFMISRTGYTGEDGVEVIFPARHAARVIEMLMQHSPGDDNGPIQPAGLGSRDSLRLEAGMALYGHEIDEGIDPVSAGLNFAMKLDKGEGDADAEGFIGQGALQRIAAAGPQRRLAGLVLEGRRAARQGMSVTIGSRTIGTVTSGTLSPTLETSIAMAYLDADHATAGAAVEVDLGRTACAAKVVDLPFYSAGK